MRAHTLETMDPGPDRAAVLAMYEPQVWRRIPQEERAAAMDFLEEQCRAILARDHPELAPELYVVERSRRQVSIVVPAETP